MMATPNTSSATPIVRIAPPTEDRSLSCVQRFRLGIATRERSWRSGVRSITAPSRLSSLAQLAVAQTRMASRYS